MIKKKWWQKVWCVEQPWCSWLPESLFYVLYFYLNWLLEQWVFWQMGFWSNGTFFGLSGCQQRNNGQSPIRRCYRMQYVSLKHRRPYPKVYLQIVLCNWNLEWLSSLITGEPSHASLCPFLIILLVIKTCWQAKLLSWVGAPLINLSSFPGHIMLFSFPLMHFQHLTLDTKSHPGSSGILSIYVKYSVVSAVSVSSL